MYLEPVCLEGRFPGRMKALELFPLVASMKRKSWNIACLVKRPYERNCLCIMYTTRLCCHTNYTETRCDLYTGKHSPQEIGHEPLTGWSCIHSQLPSEPHYATTGCWKKVLFLGWRQYPPLVPDFKGKEQGQKKKNSIKEISTMIPINYWILIKRLKAT